MRAQIRLAKVQETILELSDQLEGADEKATSRLVRKIQQARITMLLLQEVLTGIADPTTYRELTLLNKMTDAIDPEADAATEAAEADAAAVDRLAQANVTPQMASGMVRVFEALRSVSMKTNGDRH